MPWVRIDDDFPQHPKVVKAGPLGMAMQVAALCYSNRYLTDGFIPKQMVKHLLDLPLNSGSDEVVQKLLDAGLWETTDGGYMIHDYLDYQLSRKQIESRRVQKQAAGQAGGQASALARGQAPATPSGSRPVEAKVNPNPNPNPNITTTTTPTTPEELIALFTEEQWTELRTKFPDLDYSWEAKKCLEWWSSGKRRMKRPKVAFMNWLEKAREGVNGRKPQDAEPGGHPPRDEGGPSKWDIEAKRMAEP